jgi:sec-independent protein translocase protein TatA
MLHGIGLTEILVVLGVIVLLFGARRIPQMGRSLGQGIHNFYREVIGRSEDDTVSLPPSSGDQKS